MLQRYEINKKASPEVLNEKVIFGPSGRFARNRLLKVMVVLFTFKIISSGCNVRTIGNLGGWRFIEKRNPYSAIL